MVKVLRVCIEHTGYIFPDRYAFSPQAIGKNTGGKIGTFPTEGGSECFGSMTNETLCNLNVVGFEIRQKTGANQLFRTLPVDFRFAPGIVGANQFARICPCGG